MLQEDGPWLLGREMLLREIARRINAVRRSAELDQPTLAFRKGLVIFLERRVDRLNDAMATLRESLNPITEARRQTIDRMMSSVVETLRHAELEPAGQWTLSAF